ncbi:MAG: hypothetical protein EP340_11165 [Alphaproteobacteria bacterium]|nr:MAG: hypothetical protein EP340_11165 [Alphaproteobacteria bacterium]
MKPGGPWSVKGIEPEVRETAKSAARKAGKTLGEWLNHVIMESGQPDASQAAELLNDPRLWESYDGRAPWSEALEGMAAKLNASEKHHQTLLQNIDRAIAMLAERVHSQDEGHKSSGKGPDLTPEFSKRLTALEEHSKRSLLKDDLKTVEGAMSQVATILDRNNKSHEDRFQALDSSFNTLRDQLMETEAKVTEALGRIDSSFNEAAAEELHDKIITTFTEDLADIDERILAVQERTEQSFEQVQHNISDIASQLSDSSARLDAAITAPLEKAKNAVAEVSQKVEAQSAAYDARVSELETSIRDLSARLETPQAPDHGARVAELEKGLSDLNERMSQTQREQQDALSQIRGSLDGLVSRLDLLDMRSLNPQEPETSPEPEPSEPLAEAIVARSDAPRPMGLRRKSVAEAVQATEPEDLLKRARSTEFDQLVAPTSTENVQEAQLAEPATQKESQLGWAAKAFRKSAPLDDDVEPYRPEQADDEPASLESDTGTADTDLLDLTRALIEESDDALGGQETENETADTRTALEDLLRSEDPTSTKARSRKSVDDYFEERPVRADDLEDRSQGLDAPREKTSDDNEPSLNTLRNQFFSQADGEADNMRGALSEIIDPDRREGKRRTLFWVLGSLIMVMMIIGSIVILSGGAKNILNVDGRPELLQDLSRSFKSLVSPAITPETEAAGSRSSLPASEDAEAPPKPDENASVSGDEGSGNIIAASHNGSPNYFQVASLSPADGLVAAAEDGNAKAQYSLALAFANGTVVAEDQTQAVRWYRAAAEQGLAPAQYRLAARLEQGQGVDKNPSEAFTWYQKAALGGNRNAMHNLAVAYAQGTGIPQDLEAAARWFERSATLGLADSQYNLGLLYMRGLGVEQSAVESYKWFALAQKSDNLNAQDQLDIIRPSLTSGDLNYIDLYVESWAALPLDPIANGQFDVAPEAYTDQARRQIIARAQSLLARLGFVVASEDGIIDPSTQAAVRDFQSLSNLPTTGTISSDLLSRLEAQLQ